MKIDFNNLNRINIVGVSGAGKSTLAAQLAITLGINAYYLDEMYWKNNWVGISDAELVDKISNITTNNQWILDGNYNRTNALKWKNVQTIVWLDYPFWFVLKRILLRSIKRIYTNEKLWNTNNRETLIKTFFSKESIIWWMFNTYNKFKKRYEMEFKNLDSQIQTIHLRSEKQTIRFLEEVKKSK